MNEIWILITKLIEFCTWNLSTKHHTNFSYDFIMSFIFVNCINKIASKYQLSLDFH